MNYRVYGVTLGSAVPLPELGSGCNGTPELWFAIHTEPIDERGWEWLQSPPDGRDEDTWLAVARRDDEYRLKFEDGGDFVVSGRGCRISGRMHEGTLEETVRHLLINRVIPMVLSHRGRFILHASGFATSEGAVCLLGPAGAGKSTLSASFGMEGFAVVADDALVIERGGEALEPLLAVPAYAGVRVCADVLPALVIGKQPEPLPLWQKHQLGERSGLVFADQALPLRRIYVLEPNDAGAIAITRLSPRDAAIALIGHAYVLDLADPERLRRQFDRASDSRHTALVRRLSFPHDVSALPRVREAILADLARQ